MKNTILKKSLSVIVALSCLLSSGAGMAFAEETGAYAPEYEWTFDPDTQTPLETSSATSTSVHIFSNYWHQGATKGDTTLINIVKNPNAKTQSDKAMRLWFAAKDESGKYPNSSNGGGPEINIEKNAALGKTVYEFSFMLTKPINNVHFRADGGKNYKLFAFSNNAGRPWITNGADESVRYPLELNKRYTIQVVFDIAGSKGGTIKAYLNGELKTTYKLTAEDAKTFLYDGENQRSIKMNLKFWDDAATKSNNAVYLDNFRTYRYSDTAETQMIIPDLSGKTYKNGEYIRLTAKTYIGTDLENAPLDKVEYYDNGALVATETAAPYDFDYKTEVPGLHNISVKGYLTSIDEENPMIEKETSFIVEPKFRETVAAKADFENYEDKTLKWNDSYNSSLKWNINKTTDESYPFAAKVDDEHGTSLNMGKESGRQLILDGAIGDLVKGKTINMFGEMYLGKTGSGTTSIMSVYQGNGVSSSHMQYDYGTASVKSFVDSSKLAALTKERWYKFNVVTTVKDGQGYYSMYIDGERVAQGAYVNPISIKDMKNVTFFTGWNTSEDMYLDNVGISTIEYYDNSGWFDGNGNTITSFDDMQGTVLVAKTAAALSEEAQQYLAVYENGVLKDVVLGAYDAATGIITAQADIGALDTSKVKAKILVWDGMRPVVSDPEVIGIGL